MDHLREDRLLVRDDAGGPADRDASSMEDIFHIETLLLGGIGF